LHADERKNSFFSRPEEKLTARQHHKSKIGSSCASTYLKNLHRGASMRMDDQGESQNVEDVRGSSGGGFRPIHGIGLGSIVLAIIGGLIFHVNPLQLLGLMSGDQPSTQSASQQPAQGPPANDPAARFVSQVLKSTETVWTDTFADR
jgi:Putative neutral zinc metallopeptidase